MILEPIIFARCVSSPAVTVPTAFITLLSKVDTPSAKMTRVIGIIPLGIPNVVFTSFGFFRFTGSLCGSTTFYSLWAVDICVDVVFFFCTRVEWRWGWEFRIE